MAKRYAPDKNDPYPKPGRDNGGRGVNRGNGGGITRMPDVLGPGGAKNLAIDMAEEFGGTVKAWQKDINAPIKSPYNYGRGGNGNGNGGNNPGGPVVVPGGNPNDPGLVVPGGGDLRGLNNTPMQPRVSQQRGFLNPGAAQNQMPTKGIFAAQQQARPAPQQLPPEIMAWMRAQQMGR